MQNGVARNGGGYDLCGNRLIPRHEKKCKCISQKKTHPFFCVFTTIQGPVLMADGTKVMQKVGQNSEAQEKPMK